MGDTFEMIVDTEVSLDDAESCCARVIARFRELGLIEGELSEDHVLGGEGYRTSSRVADYYRRDRNEYEFWKLQSCGVAPKIGRHFNFWAFGEAFEYVQCPECKQLFDRSSDDTVVALLESIADWTEGNDQANMRCPACEYSARTVTWKGEPSPACGMLSFTFWNWPPLQSDSWHIDLVDIVQQTVGHQVVHSSGSI